MYSQLFISSGDGMQKLCKGMGNWYGNNHSMWKIFFKMLNNDHQLKINFENQSKKINLLNQLKTCLVPDKGGCS